MQLEVITLPNSPQLSKNFSNNLSFDKYFKYNFIVKTLKRNYVKTLTGSRDLNMDKVKKKTLSTINFNTTTLFLVKNEKISKTKEIKKKRKKNSMN